MPYVFTDIKYANLYHDALKKEKQFSMPSSAVVCCVVALLNVNRSSYCTEQLQSVLSLFHIVPIPQVVFKGINRDKCEKMLEKMRYV